MVDMLSIDPRIVATSIFNTHTDVESTRNPYDSALINFEPTTMHKMLVILSASLLFAVSYGFKAVPFGETRSAETLFSSSSTTSSPSSSIFPSLYDPELIKHNHTEPEDPPPKPIEDVTTLIEQLELAELAEDDLPK